MEQINLQADIFAFTGGYSLLT